MDQKLEVAILHPKSGEVKSVYDFEEFDISDEKKPVGAVHLQVDGESVGRLSYGPIHPAKLDLNLLTVNDVSKISFWNIGDWLEKFSTISVPNRSPNDSLAEIKITPETPYDDVAEEDWIEYVRGKSIDARVDFDVKWRTWSKAYSIMDLWRELHLILNEIYGEENLYFSDLRDKVDTRLDFFASLSFTVLKLERTSTVEEFTNELWSKVDEALAKAHQRSSEKVNGNKLVVEFEFHPDIRTPCEQYLLYFKQFMMDLGAEVNNEIEEKNGKTIFSVEPQNAEHALQEIRDALTAYLDLPNNSQAFQQQIAQKDISIAQLEFQVNSLNNQLMLVQSTLLANKRAMDAQQMALEALQSKDLIEYSDTEEKEEDVESIVGDLISVKKRDKNGIVVDYPEIVRKLKRTFKGEDS